jgi:signal transduction histidine kinase
LLDGYFIYFGFNDLDNMFFERNQLIVQQLVASTEYGIFSDNRELLQQQVEAVLAKPEVKTVAIYNRDHQVLALGGQLADKVNQAEPFFEDNRSMWIYQDIYSTQIQLDDAVAAMAPPISALGGVTIEVSKQVANREKIKFLVINLALVLLVLLVLLVVVNRVSRRITQPILLMRRALKRVAEGDFEKPIYLHSKISEFQALAVGLNEMTNQLRLDRTQLEQRIAAATQELQQKKSEAEEANTNKTRFLAAASHDLRQPIHALGLFVGEIQKLMVSAEQKKVAERIEQSVQAMSDLLDSLLDMSKLDAGVVVPHLQAIELDRILRRLAADYS